MTRRTKAWIAIGAAVLFTAAVITRMLVTTDEERIERLTMACRAAMLAGDAEAVRELLTEDATGGGWIGSGPLAPRIDGWADQAKRRVRDADLELREVEVEGDEARATARATVRLSAGGAAGLLWLRIELRCRRVETGWRIAHVDVDVGAP